MNQLTEGTLETMCPECKGLALGIVATSLVFYDDHGKLNINDWTRLYAHIIACLREEHLCQDTNNSNDQEPEK